MHVFINEKSSSPWIQKQKQARLVDSAGLVLAVEAKMVMLAWQQVKLDLATLTEEMVKVIDCGCALI
jgi:hypothetical protein